MTEPTNEIKQGKPKLRKLRFPTLADVYIFDGDYANKSLIEINDRCQKLQYDIQVGLIGAFNALESVAKRHEERVRKNINDVETAVGDLSPDEYKLNQLISSLTNLIMGLGHLDSKPAREFKSKVESWRNVVIELYNDLISVPKDIREEVWGE